MISVRFHGKPFNITVIQAYAPTSNAEEAEVEWFYEDLQDLLELTPKKDVLFIIRAAAAAAKLLQLCPTLCNPIDGSHQAPLSLRFSRQEHWSGLPFPSPMCESESQVTQSSPTLCDPMDCSMPGLPVHHQLLELTQTHVH